MKLPDNLIFKQFDVGPMQNFQYFIGDERNKEIALVDPAWDADFLLSQSDKEGYKVTCILLTHWHMDHLRHLYLFDDVPLCMHELDAPPLSDLRVFVDWYGHRRGIHKERWEYWLRTLEKEFNVKPRIPAKYLNDGDIIDLGNVTVEVVHTPGHSPGGLSFFFREPWIQPVSCSKMGFLQSDEIFLPFLAQIVSGIRLYR